MPLRITGSPAANCRSNFAIDASLERGDDLFPLTFDNAQPTTTATIDAFTLHPGRHVVRTGYCGAFSPDYSTTYGCTVASSATIIKYSPRVRLAAKRSSAGKRSKVQFTVKVTRFDDINGTKAITVKTAVQIYRGHGRWRTIHTGKATGRRGFIWTYTHSRKARYRAVSRETASTFSKTSRTTRL